LRIGGIRRIMAPLSERARQKRRLLRQFAVMERRIPALRRPLRLLLRDGGGVVRLPFALLLMAGGIFSFLPFLGLWMLPLGLLLLAVDVPMLRPRASAFSIRGRRWTSEWLRRLKARGAAFRQQ
jgi:hypothetical protein